MAEVKTQVDNNGGWSIFINHIHRDKNKETGNTVQEEGRSRQTNDLNREHLETQENTNEKYMSRDKIQIKSKPHMMFKQKCLHPVFLHFVHWSTYSEHMLYSFDVWLPHSSV